jgi:hypothetical protein
MGMQKVIFYTKLNCHLCLEAYQLLMECAFDLPLEIDMVDITHAHNSNLARKYGERIPVIARPDSEAELDWPFTLADIRAYLTGSIPPANELAL